MRALFILLVLSLLVFAGCKQTEVTPPAAPPAVEPTPTPAPAEVQPQAAPEDAAQVENAVTSDDIAAIDSDMQEIDGMESDLDPSQFEDSPTI